MKNIELIRVEQPEMNKANIIMERKQYQLMCTYLKGRYFVSTIYRESSTIEPMWYFETIAWEWDNKYKTRGAIVEMDDSGIDEQMAMDNNLLIVKKLNHLINTENTNG